MPCIKAGFRAALLRTYHNIHVHEWISQGETTYLSNVISEAKTTLAGAFVHYASEGQDREAASLGHLRCATRAQTPSGSGQPSGVSLGPKEVVPELHTEVEERK